MIRVATHADAAEIAEIYNHYIRQSTATFEEVPVDADEILGRMQQVA